MWRYLLEVLSFQDFSLAYGTVTIYFLLITSKTYIKQTRLMIT